MGKKVIVDNAEESDEEEINGITIKKLDKTEKEKIRKALKKKKKKLRRRNKDFDGEDIDDDEETILKSIPVEEPQAEKPKNDQGVDVEFVERDEYLLTGKYYEEFKHVFQYFTAPKKPLNLRQDEDEEEQEDKNGEPNQGDQQAQPEAQPLSRKKKEAIKKIESCSVESTCEKT